MKCFVLLGLLVIPCYSRAKSGEFDVAKFEAPEIIAPGNPACRSEEYARQYPESCKIIGTPNPRYKAPKITVNGVPAHFTQEQIIIDFLNDKTGKNIGSVDLITQ